MLFYCFTSIFDEVFQCLVLGNNEKKKKKYVLAQREQQASSQISWLLLRSSCKESISELIIQQRSNWFFLFELLLPCLAGRTQSFRQGERGVASINVNSCPCLTSQCAVHAQKGGLYFLNFSIFDERNVFQAVFWEFSGRIVVGAGW